MLDITPEAGVAIESLVAAQGASDRGGLRLAVRSADSANPQPVEMTIAATANETDLVAVEDTTHARVYLDAASVDWLADKVLDATPRVDGGYHLTVELKDA